MHPAPVRRVAMVPDVPQVSLAFGEPPACSRGLESSWRPAQTAPLEPGWTRLRPGPCAPPVHTSLHPGRAVPLRSERVSSSTDSRDLTQPLFVDTTVEYDLPKEAYPPEHSEPLLIVHPQYYEHLRHRRTLGAACACQLCNFYGRRIPHAGHEPAPAAAPAAALACPQTFQKPEAPRQWPRYQPQPQPQPQPLQAAPQPHQPQPVHQSVPQLVQQSVPQLVQQSVPQLVRPPAAQLAPPAAAAPRYNCMLDRYRREAGCGGAARLPFVTPSVSCDSDSGYSSVELEPAEWCQRQHQPQRADCDARDVLAKRKRRADVAPYGLDPAAKRLRVGYWPGGVPGLDMVPYLHHQPAVM